VPIKTIIFPNKVEIKIIFKANISGVKKFFIFKKEKAKQKIS
jgi:hypothetical protein